MPKLLRLIGFVAGTAMLVALAAVNANGTAWTLSLDAQFVLFVGGIVLVAWGLGGGFQRSVFSFQPSVILPLSGITLLAFMLRIWQLESSVHLFVDELNFAEAVTRVLDHRQGISVEPMHLLHPFHWLAAFPWLYPYWQSYGANLLGHNLSGLRLVSVILGTLTVPATYFLARGLFESEKSRRIGLLAALLLATFPPHLQFSRLALNNVADPLFGALMLAFFARALSLQSNASFVLAGICLGLTQYFYEGGRLLYPALALFWILMRYIPFPSLKKRTTGESPSKPSLRALLTFALATLLMVMPLYTVMFSYHLPLTPRLVGKGFPPEYWNDLLFSNASEGLLLRHAEHIARNFLIYFSYPDQSFYYGGEGALVLPYLIPTLLIGIAYTLWRGPRILVLCLVLASLGNSLLELSPWASGFVVTFPALTILIAVGFNETWTTLLRLSKGFVSTNSPLSRMPLPLSSWERGPGGEVKKVGRAILWALVVLLSIGQLLYYFGPHLEVYNQQVRPVTDPQDALFRALEFPPGTQVHFVGEIVFYEFDITRMQTYLERPDLQARVVRAADFNSAYLESLPTDVDHAFFLDPDDDTNLSLIRQYFTVEGPFYSPYRVPAERQFLLYYARSNNSNS